MADSLPQRQEEFISGYTSWKEIPQTLCTSHMVYNDYKLFVFSDSDALYKIFDFSRDVPKLTIQSAFLGDIPPRRFTVLVNDDNQGFMRRNCIYFTDACGELMVYDMETRKTDPLDSSLLPFSTSHFGSYQVFNHEQSSRRKIKNWLVRKRKSMAWSCSSERDLTCLIVRLIFLNPKNRLRMGNEVEEKVYELEKQIGGKWFLSKLGLNPNKTQAYLMTLWYQDLSPTINLTHQKAFTPHLIHGFKVSCYYLKVIRTHTYPYTTRFLTIAQPHLEKAQVALEPYTKNVRHCFKKLVSSTKIYHQQAQEMLKNNKVTKPVATMDLAWVAATALVGFPLIFAIKMLSAISNADLLVLNQDWFEKPPGQGNGVDHVIATYNSNESSTYMRSRDFIEATKETSGEFNPVGYDGILGLAFQGVSFGNLVPVL
ncbi:unnamed protein product [Cochlearia groenlandica]